MENHSSEYSSSRNQHYAMLKNCVYRDFSSNFPKDFGALVSYTIDRDKGLIDLLFFHKLLSKDLSLFPMSSFMQTIILSYLL